MDEPRNNSHLQDTDRDVAIPHVDFANRRLKPSTVADRHRVVKTQNKFLTEFVFLSCSSEH